MYSIYAFGIPFILTSIVFTIDHFQLVSIDYWPAMGIKRCWLAKGRWIEFIYVYIPISIIIVINIALYSVTAYKIWRVHKETSVIHHGDSHRHSKSDAETDRW
jgi:G protein-coupled receptor Mth (Methuselah protein)